MTNQSTDSPVGRRRRYTVSHLLELAPHTRGIHFDLSKFTYDAARAGVVPPLGACVMSTRRTMSDQPRNWSQGSSSSQEELVAYRGSRNVQEPERQPKGPPSEERREQDEGFARFLKKHASPTHQRVTTGGRIVPMEHRPRPPICQLATCKSNPETERKKNTREGVVMNSEGSKLDTGSLTKLKPDADDVLQLKHQPQLQLPGVNTMVDNNAVSAGLNVSLVADGDAMSIDTTAAQSHWLAPMLPAPVHPNMFADPYYLQSPHLFPSCAVPLSPSLPGYNGTMDGPFAMSVVSFPDMMGLSTLTDVPMMTGGPAATEADYVGHMVAGAAARFQELDRQLKMIDRHRAMGPRDPYLSEHRMAVVQMRANAKSELSYWSNLASEAKSAPRPSMGAPSSTLNVKAAAYVPLKSDSLVTASSGKTSIMSKGADSTPQAARPRPSPKAGPRGIPIVQPPEMFDSLAKKAKGAHPAQSASVNVDEWGVRIGDAPPELRRQQEELAKLLIHAANRSPQNSASEGSVGSSVASHSTSPLHDQPVDSSPDENEKNKAETGEWLPTKPGRAPPNIEACYEMQLDAMRLPKGVISKLRLPDGTITEVRGQGLQRPPSLEMDDFERRYWKSKPVLTKEMTSQFIYVRACDKGIAADSVLDYLDANVFTVESRTTPMKGSGKGFLAGSSSGSSDEYADKLKEKGKEGFTPRSHAREQRHKEHHSANFGSNWSEPSILTFKQSSASSNPLWLRGDDKVGWFAAEATQEAAINKGFSSVSVQNVHAIGRLPHMLDGTTDSQRRSAKLILSAAGQGRSPQRGHSATTASDAFSGLSRLAGRGPAAESEDGVQSRTIK